MDQITALLCSIPLAVVAASISLGLVFAVLLSQKYVREEIAWDLLPKGKGVLYGSLWAGAIIFTCMVALFLSGVVEFIILITVYILGGDVMVAMLFAAGPVEELFKALGAALLIFLWWFYGKKEAGVRKAMFAGAVVGAGFGFIEAMMYSFIGISNLLTDPGFQTIDLVIWRILFGASIHAVLTSLAVFSLGIQRSKDRIFLFILSVASLGFVHGAFNMVNLLLPLENPKITQILLVDGVQLLAIISLFAIAVVLWKSEERGFWKRFSTRGGLFGND